MKKTGFHWWLIVYSMGSVQMLLRLSAHLFVYHGFRNICHHTENVESQCVRVVWCPELGTSECRL
jgi:hypothetical protein